MNGRSASLWLVLACAIAGAACATSKPSESRDLPAGLSSLSLLLEGCAPEVSETGETVLMRCPDEVELATLPYGEGREATYRARANEIAANLGAQLQWDQVVVPTEAESGLVDRASAFAVSDDAPSATLIGTIHRLEDGSTKEVWCSSRTSDGAERCKELVGAALGRRDGVVAKKAAPRPAATFLGRSLSVPTTCAPTNVTKTSGTVECESGASLSWSAFPSMDDAVQALHARLDAAGDDSQGEEFGCAIGGEIAQCELRAHSVAGVTYIDGKAVMAVCTGPGDLKSDSLCRAAILPR